MLRVCLNLPVEIIDQLLVMNLGFLAVLFHLHCLLLGFSFEIHGNLLFMSWKFRDRKIVVKKVPECEIQVINECFHA